uniref:RNA-binding protein Nova n=1 Tax=Tetraselmis sp. GSL018 TaxID=582737 RepID=A0A061R3H1_9CHLO
MTPESEGSLATPQTVFTSRVEQDFAVGPEKVESGTAETTVTHTTVESETPPRNSQPAEEDDEDDGGDQYVVLKFLLSTEAAGSIIGKNGVTVGELQSQSGAKIQLSKAREFFPGTSERMMLLCGSMSSVLVALHLVLTKLMADEVPMLTSQGSSGEVSQIAMVVPNRLCGGIIGRGGSTINSFMDDSGAQLAVSPHHEAMGFSERTIYITGARESQLRAVALIATKMLEDNNYRTDEIPLSYSTEALLLTQQRFAGAAGSALLVQHPGHGAAADAPAKAHFLLPEEAVGVVIGKQGRSIQSIRHHSGAHVKIEDGHGSGQRLLVISGRRSAVAAAEAMLVTRHEAAPAWPPAPAAPHTEGGAESLVRPLGSLDVS